MIDFEKIEVEVEKEYPLKEYKGVYESYLHLKQQIAYMESEEGKKFLTDEFGEVKYLSQVDFVKKSLASRKAEVEFLKRSLKLADIKKHG